MTAAKRPSLRRRLRVTLIAAISALVVFAVIDGVGLLVDHNDRTELLGRLDPALQESDALATDLVDQETGVRGYALGRTFPNASIFLQPYYTGLAAENSDRAQLERLLLPYPAVAGELHQLDLDVAYWHQHTVTPELLGESVAHRLPGDVGLTQGKTQFDRIRADLAALDSSITGIRSAAEARAADAFWIVVAVNALAFAGLGLLLLGTARTLRRSVIAPLLEVGEDSRRVTDGDFDHPVREVGPAEIAMLAGDIEAMRSRVVLDLRAIANSQQELEEKSEELARSNRDLEQFAYVASHDLQEPLRKVASFCQLLSQRYGDQLDDRATQYIEFAVDGAKRMQSLVNDLLSFSRVGRTTDDFRDVDLADSVRVAEANLDRRMEETGATVRVLDELPTVLGDPTLLAALFQNLIGNSLKFRSDEPPVITIDASRRDDEWELTYRDNGIGIEPQFAERVFIIFQRLHTRERYEGTGIGLALCRKIVEFHRGRIWIATDNPSGTEFHITLPALPAGGDDLAPQRDEEIQHV
jgi:signal transduction histidine kinase